MAVCFCTLAIHAPYRKRARMLCADTAPLPWVVLTDEPADFADLPVRAVRHAPTGPMAIDYLQHHSPTGNNRGAAAYHDKRFALQAALQDFETAIFATGPRTSPPVRVHYHWMFTGPHYERALATLRDLGAGRDRLDWWISRLPLQ